MGAALGRCSTRNGEQKLTVKNLSICGACQDAIDLISAAAWSLTRICIDFIVTSMEDAHVETTDWYFLKRAVKIMQMQWLWWTCLIKHNQKLLLTNMALKLIASLPSVLIS
ncbi:hypothetical protein Nepgr_008175 [Nepenthes gracilis]|uniref:Uncharacterized protein n=1 Tax=Nepenthes gracilis TaxID=150966 RepID=A0AAD3S896_NEPGR|nr:hypothetical protein Nepgr_008175 [Nepenthes gracilis]